MLSEFGPSLYAADGTPVPFYGFPYPTRMAIARLDDGTLWVWSPIALTDALAAAVEALGPVAHVVSPNSIHHLFLGDWAARWPEARLYAPPGLAKKRADLQFHAELGDTPDPAWAGQIDQVVFRGSFAMKEVAFFHRPSRTAILGDLVQRFPPGSVPGWKGLVMRLDGLVGKSGSTPREWRASFLKRGPARAARETLLSWDPQRLLIAHGICAETGARGILEKALAWM